MCKNSDNCKRFATPADPIQGPEAKTLKKQSMRKWMRIATAMTEKKNRQNADDIMKKPRKENNQRQSFFYI